LLLTCGLPTCGETSVDGLLLVSSVDKAILDEITTLDLALAELLNVGKPDALGSCTLAR
jgi:hypothetical protein